MPVLDDATRRISSDSGPSPRRPRYGGVMERDFWLERWSNRQIGFHLPAANPRLVAHRDVLANAPKILVPLCGKTLDLVYLAGHGHDVVGVELAERAATDFFDEQGLSPEVRDVGSLRLCSTDRIAIAVGDFFEATSELLGAFDGVYDRAALIALPPEMRPRYVAHLRSLVRPGGRVLLVTLDFDAPGGPPFSVTEAEVRALYAGAHVSLLERVDVTEDSPNLLARGATRVSELVFSVDP